VRALAGTLAALAALVAFVPHPAAPVVALLLAIAAALLLEPAALRRAWRARTLAVLTVAAAAATALVTWSAGFLAGATTGLSVYLRLLVLALLAALAARHVGADGLLRTARRLRAERLGLVLGLALNALPHLGEAWRDAWIALAMRRRRRRPKAKDAFRLIETLLAHTGRVAEEAAAAAALRGHRALVAPAFTEARVPHLVVVTGAPGSGKTPAVASAAEVLAARGVRLAGFVQEAIMVAGEKTGFHIRDLARGEVHPLAVRVAPGDGEHGTGFRFDPSGFAVARRALEAATLGDVIVVDELGPVELRGGGHMPALLRVIRRRRPAACLLVVRRTLIPTLLGRLAASSVVVVDVETATDPAGAVAAAVVHALAARGTKRAKAED